MFTVEWFSQKGKIATYRFPTYEEADENATRGELAGYGVVLDEEEN